MKQPYIGVDDCGHQHPPEDHDEDDVGVLQHVAAVLVLLHLGVSTKEKRKENLRDFKKV